MALSVELEGPVALAPTMISCPTRCARLRRARARAGSSGVGAGVAAGVVALGRRAVVGVPDGAPVPDVASDRGVTDVLGAEEGGGPDAGPAQLAAARALHRIVTVIHPLVWPRNRNGAKRSFDTPHFYPLGDPRSADASESP